MLELPRWIRPRCWATAGCSSGAWKTRRDEPDGAITTRKVDLERDILRIVRRPADAHRDDVVHSADRVDPPAGLDRHRADVRTPTIDWAAWAARCLAGGDGWVVGTSAEHDDSRMGILERQRRTTVAGITLSLWADEGFELGDYQDAGFGWYSPMASSGPRCPTSRSPEAGGDAASLRPASAMSWACRMASSRAGRPDACTSSRLQPMWHSIRRSDLANLGHRGAAPSRRRQSCCRGWAARSSATGSTLRLLDLPGPHRAADRPRVLDGHGLEQELSGCDVVRGRGERDGLVGPSSGPRPRTSCLTRRHRAGDLRSFPRRGRIGRSS